jgi:hypothetical protein
MHLQVATRNAFWPCILPHVSSLLHVRLLNSYLRFTVFVYISFQFSTFRFSSVHFVLLYSTVVFSTIHFLSSRLGWLITLVRWQFTQLRNSSVPWEITNLISACRCIKLSAHTDFVKVVAPVRYNRTGCELLHQLCFSRSVITTTVIVFKCRTDAVLVLRCYRNSNQM